MGEYMSEKERAFRKIFGDCPAPESETEYFMSWLVGNYVQVRWFPGGIAYFTDHGTILSHEAANRLIEGIQRFYEITDPADIEALNEDTPRPATSAPEKEPISGFVYLLNEVNGEHKKIGCTRNPENRLAVFHSKLPFQVEYECLIETEDMYALESELHRRFASKRVDGEWFALDAQDVQYIKSLAGGS